jgi:hypothetical protein
MSKEILSILQLSLFYFFLYLVVIGVNFIKRRKAFTIPDDTTPESKFKWGPVFYISNEILYTASGIIILLFKYSADWTPVFYSVLLIIGLFSTAVVTMEEKFTERSKFWLHVSFIIIILLGTVSTSVFVASKEKEHNDNTNRIDTVTYNVVIPYTDKSLVKQLGNLYFDDKYLAYNTTVITDNKDSVIQLAVKNFWNDTLVNIYSKKDNADKKNLLKIDYINILYNKK